MRWRVLIFALLLTACSGGIGTMDGIMQSWQSATLDAVIAQWGYPDQEQTIGGHHLYRWFLVKQFSTPATATATQIGQTTYVDLTGGGPVTGNCTRILEVDEHNIVVRWQWAGNNCPFTEFPAYTNWRRH